VAAVPVVLDYVAFTLTVSLAFAMAYAAIAAQTLRLGDRAGAARWMLAVPYAGAAIGLVARVSSMLIDPAAHPGLFVESPVLSAGFLGLFAVTCSGSIAFLLMLRERSEAEIRHLAMFDPLTELFNRRAFMELAERELARARRMRLPIAVLMMDLDTFKRINDDFGHQAGDRVLAAFAATAKRSVRTEDVLGRYGGEEFCAILPGADMPTALEIANRIRAALAGQPLAGLARGTTVSIGVAVCGAQTAVTLDEAIACADEALYRAKNAGRDRAVGVTLAPQEKTPRLTAIATR
jgi:diguanylate cyclase (GGDEF)-like protein